MPATIFSALTGTSNNQELWITDGTALRTHLLKEINPSPTVGGSPTNQKIAGSTPLPFAVLNGFAYFSASDGTNGTELWRTDGTPNGTAPVTAIAGDTSPTNIVTANNLIFFDGNGSGGQGIYKYDGVNTTFVSAATPISNMVSSGGRVYWTTEIGTALLFSSDGTTTGQIGGNFGPGGALTDVGGGFLYLATTVGLRKISGTTATTVTGAPVAATVLTSVNDTVFLTTQTPTELWITTTAGTTATQIKTGLDLNNLGGGGSSPISFAALGNLLIFANNDDLDNNANTNAGNELWVSDGTANGTVLLKDLVAGTHGVNQPNSGNPTSLTKVGNVIFFQASDGAPVGPNNATGVDLWKTDGTANGTVLVKHIASVNATSNGQQAAAPLTNLTEQNGLLYFTADVNGTGPELWRSNGTAAGTFMVKDINASTQLSAGYDNQIFFSAASIGGNSFFPGFDSTNGYELWVTNGTLGGTALLKDINPGFNNSLASPIAVLGSKVILLADDGTHGKELWSTDGTVGGTALLRDINASGDAFFNNWNPSQLSDVLGNKFLFAADDGINGIELWATDGTTNGTTLLADIFTGSSNGSPSSGFPLNFVNVGSQAFFTASSSLGNELWVTDETSTHITKDIATGSSGGTPNGSQASFLTPFQNKLFFAASDRPNGFNTELWMSDGTANGTQPVKEINTTPFNQNDPASGSAFVNGLVVANNHLFFFASTVGSIPNMQLWKSDGTDPTTVPLTNIANLQPQNLVSVGSAAYFTGFEQATGFELYTTSGNAPQLINIATAANVGSNPSNLTAVGGSLFFSAQDTAANGTELWVATGTTASLVKNINPNANASSNPSNFFAAGSLLYFVADDGTNGAELWVSDGDINGPGTHMVRNINATGANQGSSPSNFKLLANGKLMFQANDGPDGNELYITDGTNNGTFRASDIQQNIGSNPLYFTLVPNVDLGAAAETLNGTPQFDFIDGGGGNDIINGLGSDDILVGGLGDDTIDGGTGNDTMSGGPNNDTFLVDSAGDVVIENINEGTADTVLTGLASYTLPTNVEKLAGTSASGQTLTGNNSDNVITSGAGADVMAGGSGNDTYVVNNAGDLVLEVANDGNDTVLSSVNFVLPANVEVLNLQGSADLQGYGNNLPNTLVGNTGNNLLDGGANADIMQGGAGNDIYFVDNIGDVVTEGVNAGNDSVFASANFTLSANVENLILQGSADLQGYGNGLANQLYGNTGNNLLNGFGGVDLMAGGAGDDVYFVDNPSDSAFEVANQGNDSVFASSSYGLAADVENLILQGSGDFQAYGNSQANTIYGNSGNNLINAGGGIDLMAGGAGNDIYYVDDPSDVCFEVANEGGDAVFATCNYGLAADVESLILQGSADLQGYGNNTANTLNGNTGNNLLNGGGGADLMVGGAGNDVYFVDNIGDGILENAAQGNDSVFAGVSYALSANVEGLVLQGAGNIDGIGNAIGNSIVGNAGNNTLDGGAAADQLTGNAGNDIFLFRPGQAIGDAMVDFAGNGAAAGDSLSFIGYGVGATFTNIDATHWQVNYNAGASHDIITFMNGAPIDPTDFSFV